MSLVRSSGIRRRTLIIGLYRAAQLDAQRVALAVDGLADHHPDPAFRDAIFLDIGLLDALEADADAAFEQPLFRWIERRSGGVSVMAKSG